MKSERARRVAIATSDGLVKDQRVGLVERASVEHDFRRDPAKIRPIVR